MFGKPFCAAAACLLLFAALPFSACAPQEEPRGVYAIEAEYEDGTLRASMRFSFCNGTGEPLSALDFNLYGNAFREGALYPPVTPSSAEAAYWAGESCGEMKILSVSPCAGWEVCGEDENILRVTPEQELFPGEKAETEIVWELKLAEINHRTGISESAVNLGNFYPVLCVSEEGRGFVPCAYSANGDPFYSECADYEVTFTAPASYTVAASGEAVSASVSGGRKTSVYRLENARDFALCLSENFRTAMGEACGVPVAYYYTDDADPQRSLALLEECFAWYSRKFGAYPYGSFSAAQTGFCYGGMEYPGLVFISSAAEGEELAYTLAHETAHQWVVRRRGQRPDAECLDGRGARRVFDAAFFRGIAAVRHPDGGAPRRRPPRLRRPVYRAGAGVRRGRPAHEPAALRFRQLRIRRADL